MADDPLWGSRNRRHRLSITAEVLQVARKGALKTQIMYEANLGFSQLNKYLSLLLDYNLLEAVKTLEKTTYKTTDKGLRYIRRYIKIMELLKNYPKEANSLRLIKCGPRVIVVK